MGHSGRTDFTGFDFLFEIAVEAGAENLEETDESFDVITSMDDFAPIRDALIEKFGDPLEAKVIWRPQNAIECDEEAARKILKLIDILEDSDDVQNVYSNFVCCNN